MLPALNLAMGCATLAVTLHMAPDQVSQFAAFAAPLLNSGTLVLESIQQRVAPASELAVERLLDAQVSALYRIILLLLRDAAAATVSSLLPPQHLLRWWAAVAGALEERAGIWPGNERLAGSLGCTAQILG